MAFHFETYKVGTRESAFNTPHRFKELGSGIFNINPNWRAELIERWERQHVRTVNKKLIEKISESFQKEDVFYLVIPPTGQERKKLFFDPLIQSLKRQFPNCIDLQDCFSKNNDQLFAAVETNIESIRQNVLMNENCIHSKLNSNTKAILIYDDVFANGNTIQVLKDKLEFLKLPFTVITLIKTERE